VTWPLKSSGMFAMPEILRNPEAGCLSV
jgi:hypothetical protein